MSRVLLTGASGFLGEYLVRELLKEGHEIFALSRTPKTSENPKLRWVVADMSSEDSLLQPSLVAELEGVDVVVHAAALYDLGATQEQLYQHNVIGTANVLHLCRLFPKRPHFAHISTIAIAGNARTNFTENDFDQGQTFPDAYASTKFASEQLVRSSQDFPSRSIYRLGIVVGSSEDGKMTKIDGPYYVQKLLRGLLPYKKILEKIRFLPLPYHESSRLYILPVDTAAQAIVQLVCKVKSRMGLETFHVIGGKRGVSVRKALQFMLQHYKLDVEPVPVPVRLFPRRFYDLIRIPAPVSFYLGAEWTFSSERLEAELKGFRYPSYGHYSERNMQYADQHLLGGERS